MSAKQEAIKKIEKVLFLSDREASEVLTPTQLERKKRLMICVSKKMDNPMISDKELVDFMTAGCDGACSMVTISTAYRDVAALTRIFGNIQLAAKSWYRYMIVEGAKEAFKISKEMKDGKGMAAALDKIGKYTRADKEDDAFDWERMIPPSFEPTDDVSVLGDDLEKIPNVEERRKELRQLFNKRNVKDAEIIDEQAEQ